MAMIGGKVVPRKQESEFIIKWEKLKSRLIDNMPMDEAINEIMKFIDEEVMQKIDIKKEASCQR